MAASGKEFEAQVKLEFEDLDRIQTQLAEAIDKAFGQGAEMSEKLVKNFAKVEATFASLKTQMQKATNETDFRNAREAMGIIAQDAQKMARAVMKTKGIGIVDAGRIRAASREMNQFARAQEFVAQKTIKTSLAAQNVVRVIQDAPFGMFGIANNIEQLAESFTMLMKQTGSVRKSIASMFMPLVTGPMAIPFVISLFTAFTLSADKLAEQFDKLKVKLGQMTEAQAEYNKELKKLEESGVKDVIDSLTEDELFFAEGEIETKLSEQLQKQRDFAEAFKEEFGFTLEQAKEASESLSEARTTSAAIGQGGFVPSGSSDRSGLQAQAKAWASVKNEVENLNGELTKLQEAEERLANRRKLDAEKFDLRRRLGLTEFGQDDVSGASTKDKKKKEKKIMSEEDRMTQLRIAAMQEGIAKQIAQIRFNGEQERKQLIENYGANSETIALLDEKINQQVREAADEHTKTIVKGLEKEKKERERLLKQQAAEARKLRLEAIREQTQIAIFGLEQRALAFQNNSSGDIWEQEINQQVAAADRERALIDQRILELAELLNTEEISRREHNAEIRKLSEERVRISQNEAAEIEAIERSKRDVIRDINQQTLAATGDFFGSMASIAESEGDKALETQKKYLFAQALAQAISSGISAYNAYMQMPGGPAKIAFAAASMLSITARLKASAEQIKNIKPGGSASTNTITGGFTQLNSAVVGQRIESFQRQQSLDTTRSGNGDVVGAINELGTNIAGQQSNINARITYDDRTAADIVEKGTRLNNQLTGRITANSFQG